MRLIHADVESYVTSAPAIVQLDDEGHVIGHRGADLYGHVKDKQDLVDGRVPQATVNVLLGRAATDGAVTARLPARERNGRPFMANVTITRNEHGYMWVADKIDEQDPEAARLLRLELRTHEIQEYARLAVHGIRSPLMALRWQAEMGQRGHAIEAERSLALIDGTIEVLSQALEFSRIRLSERGPAQLIELEERLESHAELEVCLRGRLMLDLGLMARALNLLVGHAERRGAAHVTITSFGSNIDITHDGEPLGPRAIKRVWTPFHEDPDGQGVAMATVRKIVHLHQGQITARADGFLIQLPDAGTGI